MCCCIWGFKVNLYTAAAKKQPWHVCFVLINSCYCGQIHNQEQLAEGCCRLGGFQPHQSTHLVRWDCVSQELFFFIRGAMFLDWTISKRQGCEIYKYRDFNQERKFVFSSICQLFHDLILIEISIPAWNCMCQPHYTASVDLWGKKVVEDFVSDIFFDAKLRIWIVKAAE